jgi:hypothetical protein
VSTDALAVSPYERGNKQALSYLTPSPSEDRDHLAVRYAPLDILSTAKATAAQGVRTNLDLAESKPRFEPLPTLVVKLRIRIDLFGEGVSDRSVTGALPNHRWVATLSVHASRNVYTVRTMEAVAWHDRNLQSKLRARCCFNELCCRPGVVGCVLVRVIVLGQDLTITLDTDLDVVENSHRVTVASVMSGVQSACE